MCHALSGERDNYYGAVHRLQTLTSRGSCRTIIPPYILYTKESAKIASGLRLPVVVNRLPARFSRNYLPTTEFNLRAGCSAPFGVYIGEI